MHADYPAINVQDLNRRITEARKIADQLNALLREDALHRLEIYQDYSRDFNARRWTPDFYRRCQLVEALCRKLGSC